MITTQHACQAVHGVEPDALRELVGEVLLGKKFLPLAARGFDEMPEDVFVAILSAPEAPERQAILDGLIRFLARVAAVLFDSTRPLADELRPALDHLAALVSLAKPPELKSRFLPLVELAIKDTRLDPKLRASLIRPAVSYAAHGDDPHLWEACITQPELAAYGFSALLRIDPANSRIPQHLKQLWVGTLEGRLPIFVADLTRRAIKARGSDGWLKPMFNALVEHHPELVPQLREELARHRWSAPWAQELPYSEPVVEPFPVVLAEDFMPNDDALVLTTNFGSILWSTDYDTLLEGLEFTPAAEANTTYIGFSKSEMPCVSVDANSLFVEGVGSVSKYGRLLEYFPIVYGKRENILLDHLPPKTETPDKPKNLLANVKMRMPLQSGVVLMLDEMSFATITPKGAENRLNRAIAPNDYRVHTLARHHQSRRSKFKFLFKQT